MRLSIDSPTNSDATVALVRDACCCLEANLDRRMTLADLGKCVGSSPYHLQRTFKRVVGLTPRQYVEAKRLALFKERLRTGNSVTSSVYEAGFGSTSRLYERSEEHLGMKPTSYQAGGEGISVGYSIAECPFGRVLVAATEKGVCFVGLGDCDEDILAHLYNELPGAGIARDDELLGEWLKAVVKHLEGNLPDLDLPLDIRATAFQRRVWEELQRIPYGETRSYREIAIAIGEPKAARAVGNACATNPAAIIIPCHRVVRSDGSIGEYGWGRKRKERLLAQERELRLGDSSEARSA